MSIASTAVTRYDPTIQLPVAADASRKEDSESELVFNIAWKDSEAVTTFEEQPVEPASLVALIAERVKADGSLRILIRSDAEAPVRHVNAIVELAAKAGVSEVTFAAVLR
ncbi:MAG TPA: biopolymer transporter ExbD [Opitutaceae bacterium]|nr:biopolymer transporter ExbD [Opitutaceae bacterium]